MLMASSSLPCGDLSTFLGVFLLLLNKPLKQRVVCSKATIRAICAGNCSAVSLYFFAAPGKKAMGWEVVVVVLSTQQFSLFALEMCRFLATAIFCLSEVISLKFVHKIMFVHSSFAQCSS